SLVGSSTKKAEAYADPVFAGCSICTMEATLSTSGGGKTFLLAWYTDKKNVIEVTMREDKDKWIVTQKNVGSKAAKMKISAPIVANVDYDVQVSYDGLNIILTVNGVVLGSMPTSAAPSGTIGFRVKKSTLSIAQLSVY